MTMSSSARETPLGRFALTGFAAALLLLAGVARLLLRGVSPASRVAAMTAFVLPGMIGDSLTTALYGVVFPNLPNGAGVFGGLMLLAYSVMLAVSLAMTSGRLTP
jgi:hypothetical protein